MVNNKKEEMEIFVLKKKKENKAFSRHYSTQRN